VDFYNFAGSGTIIYQKVKLQRNQPMRLLMIQPILPRCIECRAV